jgi:hypothetical protein
LSNPRAPRRPRLPHPKLTTINPKDSRYERRTTGGGRSVLLASKITKQGVWQTRGYSGGGRWPEGTRLFLRGKLCLSHRVGRGFGRLS